MFMAMQYGQGIASQMRELLGLSPIWSGILGSCDSCQTERSGIARNVESTRNVVRLVFHTYRRGFGRSIKAAGQDSILKFHIPCLT